MPASMTRAPVPIGPLRTLFKPSTTELLPNIRLPPARTKLAVKLLSALIIASVPAPILVSEVMFAKPPALTPAFEPWVIGAFRLRPTRPSPALTVMTGATLSKTSRVRALSPV